MTVKRQKKNKMTPGEYLALERSSLDIKHEFFDGDVFAMVGAGINHNRININLAGELRNRFKADNSPCEVLSNDMRVKIENNYTYPDIVIFCGDAQFEDNKFDTLTNPVIIIEILSDSTEAFDRGDKFTYYRAIPALKEYILVSQKKYHVEQYIRSDNGKWEYRSYESPDQMLNMESVNCDVLLSEIYLNVNFETQSRED
ncbi:MAG: Uma2 family endonuclease [Desulfobacter sp.]|uniref:Uma2 family endonuclease n=1 Tax=Desulfobacter sp. TaxID=2294 RepID=UPI001B6E69F4|nr:Uma2 family endonuclease [Desulfobacter sp.]MBP8829447.1 Uma2 family endonuclease [Desulfobacter sp.]MBP9598772.1 Uma2 family endonuclease [Desulfobacter sp.]